MRHRKNFNHLGRKTGHRKAMLANMASSLIMHKRISTTTAKAKALRIYVEPLITKSKDDSTHSRRVVFSYLQNKEAVSELFREVSTKILDRPGGYTRILKTGTRLGDNADMCIIELVDYNENLLSAQDDSKSKSTRRRKRGTKKVSDSIETKGTGSKEKQSKVDKKETPASKSEPVEVETIEEAKAEIVEPTIEDKAIESKADEGTKEEEK